MKILFVTPDFHPKNTGFANASLNLINSIIEYSKNKYQIFVFTVSQLNGEDELNIKAEIIRYKPNKKSRLLKFFNEKKVYNKLKKIIKLNSIDIIFFETNTFPYLQYWTLKEFGSKVFVRIHSTADTEVVIYDKPKTIGAKIALNLIKVFMHNVNNIVSTSNYYIDFIKHKYLNDNVYTIWNNKSYSIIHNTSLIPSNHEIIEKINSQKNVFMSMGKLSQNGLIQKGMEDLLKAIYYINYIGELTNDFKLIIIGDGEMYSYLQKMIDDFELINYVELIKIASHEETLRLISISKAIVLLSRYEGQSMFVTESLSLGKPVILSNDNGMGDMIEHQKNGILVKKGDPIDAANAIIKIMKMDLVNLNSLGLYSKKIYDSKFSNKSIYQQFDRSITLRIK
jgi:glycosyltransferase involved in cell wall biosynthesis